MDNIKIDIENLKVYFPLKSSFIDILKKRPVKYVKAIDDLSLKIFENEVLGVVGETGCGKSTIAKTILLMNPIKNGSIKYQGKNIQSFNSEDLKSFYSDVQLIWQDPYSSLNPRMKVYELISRPYIKFKNPSKQELKDKIHEIVPLVGLNKNDLWKYPHEFSGGGRQRIVIARALIHKPSLLIADEPTSSLDVSIQAQILNLLKSLKDNFNLTMLFISHNISVINYISTRVAVMFFGRIVEVLPKSELFVNNYHYYTHDLFSSIPKGVKSESKVVSNIKDYRINYNGCIYYYRCSHSKENCFNNKPILKEITKDHFVACHYPNL